MTALGDARAELVGLLEAAGIEVRDTPSVGHISPPAAIVTPGPEWLVPQVLLGAQTHARLQLTVTLITGKVSAGASLADLEALVELALPVLTPHQWIAGSFAQPFALSIAGTDYLASSCTMTRSLVIA